MSNEESRARLEIANSMLETQCDRLSDIFVEAGPDVVTAITSMVSDPDNCEDYGFTEDQKDVLLQTFAGIGASYVLKQATEKCLANLESGESPKPSNGLQDVLDLLKSRKN